MTVGGVYSILPWQMLDLTPGELDGMLTFAKGRFGA